MRLIQGGNYSWTRGASLPIEVTEDTAFVGTNFCQKAPHTPVFQVDPGVRLVLENVNAVNVTLPDEMAPDDFTGNNAQVIPTETGNPERPTVNLLHECEKCATFTHALREEIASGRWRQNGRIVRVKGAARRRRGGLQGQADLAAIRAENMAALAKWVPDEQETEGWFARLWTKAKALVGIE